MTGDEMGVHIQNLLRTADRIESKVDKTNGRVSALERFKAQAQGAWFVASLAGPVITGIILKFA